MTRFDHPLLDFIEGQYACMESRATVVYFSEPLADFLQATHEAGLTPVVMARPDTRWTFAARYYLDAVGAHRLVRFDDAFVNIETAASGDTITEACTGDATRWERETPAAPDVLQAVVAVSAHHSAAVDVQLGGLADTIASRLARCQVNAWGVHEPAPLTWEHSRYTEYLRSQMPVARTFLTGGGGIFQGIHSVRRTRAGVMETVTAMMPVASLGTPFEEVVPEAVQTLTEVAEQVSMPMTGSVCVMPGWRHGAFPTGPTPLPAPAAVLIGPRAVRAMGADLETLAEEHAISTAGRKRLPSIIAGFHGQGATPWQQAYALAEAFGSDALARAVGVEGDR